MTYSQAISAHVDKIVLSFIDKIVSSNPTVSKDALVLLWNNNSTGTVVAVKGGGGDEASPSSELTKLSKTELVELCKAKNLKHTGTKPELVQRLVNFEKEKTHQPQITPKLVHKAVPPIALHRNKFGNFEHPDTNFVFNEKTEKVYGRQNADGTVSPLTVDDINLCNKFKFSYDVPLNLQDNTNTTTDKALLELEEEEEEEELEVEVEEEEEEEEEEEVEVELEIDEDD